VFILLTNDDGIDAPGLTAAETILAGYRTATVAPLRHCSGSGQALGLYSEIQVEKRGDRRWAVDGTPTDCVKLAMLELLDRKPDLVVSGINPGPNLAHNIHYSGTVAAATEAALWGVPALAVSIGSGTPRHLDAAASYVASLVEGMAWRGIPEGAVLNVNIPDSPLEELGSPVWTRTGRFASDVPFTVVEPGRIYRYTRWTGQEVVDPSGTDVEALSRGMISLTLLSVDRTLEGASLAGLE
jgi:5'-nucleotidase